MHVVGKNDVRHGVRHGCGERCYFVTMSNSYTILIKSATLLKYNITPMAWRGRAVVFGVGVQFLTKPFPRYGIQSCHPTCIYAAYGRAQG